MGLIHFTSQTPTLVPYTLLKKSESSLIISLKKKKAYTCAGTKQYEPLQNETSWQAAAKKMQIIL
jgi:hypothetical protein